MTASSRQRIDRLRRGNTTTTLVACTLIAMVAIGGIVYWTMYGGEQTAATGPILNEVSKGPYDFMVLEQGEVEPASAIELRCEVKSRSAGGSSGSTTIIEVVPEGTFVKGPRPEAPKGDLLVKLDSRSLELEFKQQQITVNTSDNLVFQAKKTLEVAEIAKQEYLQGTFRQEKSVIESEVFVTEQSLTSAQLAMESSERLGAKGLLSSLQLEGARYAVKKAENDTDVRDTHYLVGSVVGPDPFPRMVRDFQSVIGRETRAQCLDRFGRLPEMVIACVGGGSNAIGMFHPLLADPITLVGVEAAGHGIDTAQHAATLTRGRPGVLHGARTVLLQDEDGQIQEAHSISAGLDYPGVGPEHAHLRDIGRVRYESVTDDEALSAFRLMARLEGIVPALESAHAVAFALRVAPQLPSEHVMVINLSGRGDKDLDHVMALSGGVRS